jgi:acetyltransferase-like isoleucine patch superfamily enzyme
MAARIACLGTLPFHHRSHFANHCAKGFIAPTVVISNPETSIGKHVYLGDRLMITRNRAGGSVKLADRVHLYGDSCLETGLGGNIYIGQGAHMQPGCRIHAFISDITIGSHVEIAPHCAFYSYDHGMMVGKPIMDQPLASKGRIVVGDGAWIGHGVTVLQGVRIGEGAVIGAGAVVVDDIPENAIAVGVPARVVGYRPGVNEEGMSNTVAQKIGAIA